MQAHFLFSCHTHTEWKVIIKGRFQRQSQLMVNIEERNRNGNLFEHRTFLFFLASCLNQEVSEFFFFFFFEIVLPHYTGIVVS